MEPFSIVMIIVAALLLTIAGLLTFMLLQRSSVKKSAAERTEQLLAEGREQRCGISSMEDTSSLGRS